MLGSESALCVDDEGFRFLLVANLAYEGGIVGEHQVGVHDFGVGRDKGKGGRELVSVDVAIGCGLTGLKGGC